MGKANIEELPSRQYDRYEMRLRKVLFHWKTVRREKLDDKEQAENLRCATDLAKALGIEKEDFWKDDKVQYRI